ncbi:diaminohydroxyphosphoribosylaminopyrimidine deaminase/5-amino-6-(5-phosphoribosylamino)uracil reductase [Elusimicrobium posterum]|uniref:bifunctional diaminohydroxyphosphoribosylaminopyrimidine deaminase/5-amino-6-(5-phosphoribosylamino)uracil reductase RibD n=1 Tax=Elusimicrobium posterum TaxID=3116653 RepID=UPI003C721394
MQYSKENIKYMKRALELAKKGKGLVYPNPMVGCVIVKDGKIVAEGYHKIFGGLHAEANALNAAGKKAKGADLYCTLEPCNHYGKRPPCSDYIIKAGIKRVFCSHVDPNKNTNSKGITKLRAAGIEVHTGLLKKETVNLNKEYIKYITSVKAHVAVKFAMTLDGKIATRTYDSKWISSEKSRNFVHKLRTQYDAILTGQNTVIKDNPSLTSHSMGKNPVRVIIDQKLKTPKSYHVLDCKTPTIVVYDIKTKKIPSYFLKEGINLLALDFKEFKKDFKVLTAALEKMALKRLLIEGGGETISSALFSGAVNEIYAFVSPVIAGGRDAISPVEGLGADKIKNALKIKNMKIQKISSDLLIRGTL